MPLNQEQAWTQHQKVHFPQVVSDFPKKQSQITKIKKSQFSKRFSTKTLLHSEFGLSPVGKIIKNQASFQEEHSPKKVINHPVARDKMSNKRHRNPFPPFTEGLLVTWVSISLWQISIDLHTPALWRRSCINRSTNSSWVLPNNSPADTLSSPHVVPWNKMVSLQFKLITKHNIQRKQ